MVAAKITGMKAKPQEVLDRMGLWAYQRAYDEGMNLSTWLELEHPSTEYKDGLDAFERLLKLAGIIGVSDPDRGIYASQFSAFDNADNLRALVPEWIARQARRAATGKDQSQRALSEGGGQRMPILSTDQGPGSWMAPYAEAASPRLQQVQPAIPLSEIVALTTPIDTDAYRAFYLTRDVTQLRMVRVAQGGEIPRLKLVGGDHTIRLHKFGRGLEASYEALRRLRIDMVALIIQLMAVQAEVDKVVAALDILVNGDGNSGTAPTTLNLTTLDPAASAGTLTLKGWLNFKMNFTNPYVLSTMLAQQASVLQAMLLNTGNANIPLVYLSGSLGVGGLTAINPGLRDNVATGWLAEAPSLKLVGFDKRFAIEHVTEIGADITEVERFVSRQTQVLFMTTVDGFVMFDVNAVRILNINA